MVKYDYNKIKLNFIIADSGPLLLFGLFFFWAALGYASTNTFSSVYNKKKIKKKNNQAEGSNIKG